MSCAMTVHSTFRGVWSKEQERNDAEHQADHQFRDLEESSDEWEEPLAEDHPLRWLTPTPPASPRDSLHEHVGGTGCALSVNLFEMPGGFMDSSATPHFSSAKPYRARGIRGRRGSMRNNDTAHPHSNRHAAPWSSASTTVSEDSDDSSARRAASTNSLALTPIAGMIVPTVISMTCPAGMSAPALMAVPSPAGMCGLADWSSTAIGGPAIFAMTSPAALHEPALMNMTAPAEMCGPVGIESSGTNSHAIFSMTSVTGPAVMTSPAKMCEFNESGIVSGAHASFGVPVVGMLLPVGVGVPIPLPPPAHASSGNSCIAVAPPLFGDCHRFHAEAASFGTLSEDGRQFTKETYHHQLSVVSEDQVRTHGVHSYAVQFTGGELSSADGVGFIFSSVLPCPKNIQRIVSIFVNRAGKICVRARSEVVRSATSVRPLQLGDWVGVTVDIDLQLAHFTVWPANGSSPSHATMAYGDIMESLRNRLQMRISNCGYLACVVKFCGVTVNVVS